MRKLLLCPVIGAFLLLSGCGGDAVMSLNPFFAKGDLYDEPRIEATLAKDGSRVERISLGKYRVCNREGEDCAIVHTFRTTGVTFADIQDDGRHTLTIAPHFLVRLNLAPPSEQEDGETAIKLSSKGLQQLLDGRASSLAHTKISEGLLLTGSTEELRAFLQRHAVDPLVFSNEPATCRVTLPLPPQPPPATLATAHPAQ